MKKNCLFGWICLPLLFLFFWGCEEKMPVNTDGSMSLNVAVFDTTGLVNAADSSRMTPIAGAKVTLNSGEYGQSYVCYTDENGIAHAENLVASSYEISAEYNFSVAVALMGGINKDVIQSTAVSDTILTHTVTLSPIVINELYTCGPVNNSFFFFDQFVELYNRTDEVQYLDGLLLTRCVTNPDNDPFMDSWDYVKNLYVFQFPGQPGGTEHPIDPHEFVVIALDAYDHSQSIPGAVDLSHADWEFYSQTGADYDNPDVPNLLNINPAKTQDLMLSLTADAMILAQGTNFWQDGDYIDIHINTILDGLEYKSTATTSKHLTRRVDSGYIQGVTRYSGKSRERISPGKDTNNSNLDFRVIDHPTPGYQWNGQ